MSAFSHLQDLLIPVFQQYGISKADLFGSMAKNTDTEKSDLDLLVYSNLHGLQFVGFMEEIRQAVNRPVDILDISHIEPDSRILHEIEESGIVLYEK